MVFRKRGKLVSAKSVYSRKKAPAKIKAKTRGRPQKVQVAKTSKRKVTARRGRPKKIAKVEEHSSEADNSSEGEEEEGLENSTLSREEITTEDDDAIDQNEETAGDEDPSEEGENEEEIADDDEEEEEVEDEKDEEENEDEKDDEKDEEENEDEKDEEENEDEENLPEDGSEIAASSNSEDVRYSLAEPALPKATGSNGPHLPKEIGSKRKNESFENTDRSPKKLKIKKKAKQDLKDSDNDEDQQHIQTFSVGLQTALVNNASSQTRNPFSVFFTPQTSSMVHYSSLKNHVKEEDSALNDLDTKNQFAILTRINQNKLSICGNYNADDAFRWLISPVTESNFFNTIYEKRPFHQSRKDPSYYRGLFCTNDINTMLKENNLQHENQIDVVKYIEHQKVKSEGEGRAYCSNVWDDFKNGYSVRIRNPQAYHNKLWKMCANLQEYFSSPSGVNIYLTPPNAQGFPPHYDDIDAFIVQVEGSKHWRVYPPRCPNEELARYASIDFQQNELGAPLLERTLKAGDFLYIPRGYIHQADTSSKHSLHLTFSVNQLNSWGDLLLPAVNKAFERAILNDVEFRKSVPIDYLDCAGKSLSKSKVFPDRRHAFKRSAKTLFAKAMEYFDPDEAADDHALKFIRSCQPPGLTELEKQHSVHGSGSYWKNKDVIIKDPITLNTEIQFIRKRNIRIIIDESGAKIFHNLENSKERLEEQESLLIELDPEALLASQYLFKKYPQFVRVNDLPMTDEEDKLLFTNCMFENGIIMTKEPLQKRSS